MLFADFQTWLGQELLWLAIFIAMVMHLTKNFVSPEIKSAAKSAATKKAIGMIGKWLR